jgi:regulator of protease activity HflC (stomatin/prohibitin superfamily)
VPKIKLDDVFEKKDDIANIVKSELAQVMEGFGYGILKALVTDIDPDAKVKESMNEINAAQRMRVAATERGEADRILKVKAAEGDAQSKACRVVALPINGRPSSPVCAIRWTSSENPYQVRRPRT